MIPLVRAAHALEWRPSGAYLSQQEYVRFFKLKRREDMKAKEPLMNPAGQLGEQNSYQF